MKFRKKPVVIEAWQNQGAGGDPPEWVLAATSEPNAYGDLAVDTLEGAMIARYGDWLIRGIKGEVYPCKPDIFEATYERVEKELGT